MNCEPTFLPLTFASLPKISPFFLSNESRFCDLTLSNLYMWRNDLSTGYYLSGPRLVVRKEYEKGKMAYLFPKGEEPLDAVKEIASFPSSKKELSFFALQEKEASELSSLFPHSRVYSLEEWDDYLYSSEKLMTYAGKKLSGKRHNANKFHSLYPETELVRARKEDVPALLSFLKKYEEENKGRDISYKEDSFAFDVLSSYPLLGDIVAYYRYKGEIIALAEAEKVGDTLYVHIEKCLREYEGIYQALTSEFLMMNIEGISFENREEDDGNMGLREAKSQLQPLVKLQKRFFTLTNNIDLYSLSPIIGDKVDLLPMEERYAKDYFALATDEERNLYWGYDYHVDLKGEEATPSFFLNDILNDYKTKSCFSFVIANKEGSFLGEAVLHDFRDDGSCQLGVRIKENSEGQGIAFFALKELISLCKSLNIPFLRYESYKENAKSLSLASHLGFNKVGEDPETNRLLFRMDL